VQYEITDGKKYLFHSADVRQNIRDVAVVSMRTAVGDRLDRDILSTGRDGIARDAKRLMQSTLDQYDIGIRVIEVLILDANPPDQVRGAFHRVNEAKQEMEEMIQRAQGEYNSVVPQSYGKAERLVLESKAYAIELKSKSMGEAARFDAILAEYKKSPEVIRDRYYIEAMEDLYTRMSVTLIDSGLKGILPLFPGHNPQEARVRDQAALAAQHPAIQREMAVTAGGSHGAPAPELAPVPPPAGAAELLPHSQPQAVAAREIPPPSVIQEPPASTLAPTAAPAPQGHEAPPSVNRVEPLSLPSRAANSR
jgi:HflK protein